MDYALDGEVVRNSQSFPSCFPTGPVRSETVLVTGATGFLGASILKALLNREPKSIRILALVRAKSEEEAKRRVKLACIAYGTWSDSWDSRIKCITGDLSKEDWGSVLMSGTC